MAKDDDVPNSSRVLTYWDSKLFSKVYLENDLKRDFPEKWESDFDDIVFDEDGNTLKSGFYHFYNEFRNIADSLRNLTKRKLSETDTITKIICPVLNCLGWYDKCSNTVEEPFAAETSFSVPRRGKSKIYRTDILLADHPQEAIFISDADTSSNKREARQYCIAPLEAKYWNRIAEKEHSGLEAEKSRQDKERDDTSLTATFNEQVLNYMTIVQKKWGIVSDGNTWRLINSDVSGEDSERCFEFKLEALLSQEAEIESGKYDDAEFMENAKYFYLFFGKPSFVKDKRGRVFVDEVLKESRKYIDCIEDDLKDRFISAMNITCNGFLSAAKNNGTIKSPTKADLDIIRTVSESHLFNTLFIKSCESKGILPIKAHDYYKISLTGIIDRLSMFDPEKYISKTEIKYQQDRLVQSLNHMRYSPNGTNLYKNLLRLTEVIHNGAKKDDFGFEIKGFKESVFSKKELRFAQKHQLKDEEVARILFELGYSKAATSIQKKYQQIPYSYFTPRQLGSIYESFLEYKLDVATERMVYVKRGEYKQWIKLTSAIETNLKGHEPTVKKGELFFTPNNEERKSTGSYYTPDFIVQYLVSNCLADQLEQCRYSNEVLQLTVCDPAMGSGHFLIAALKIITKRYMELLEQELPSEKLPPRQMAMRNVLDSCIFGVDINSRAVKLSKMSLWLESAYKGKKLERLDDQIKQGDSLVHRRPGYELSFDWDREYFKPKKFKAFSAVITNPPYLAENEHREKFDVIRDTPLWQFHRGKMDYWYFFVHLSLKILKQKGRLGLIATDYWKTNYGASCLRNAISATKVKDYISFGNYRVFKDAKGQHNMLLVLENTPADSTSINCKVLTNANLNESELASQLTQNHFSDFEDRTFLITETTSNRIGNSSTEEELDLMESSPLTLDDIATIGTGIQAGPDALNKKGLSRISKKVVSKFGLQAGDGVFVVPSDTFNPKTLNKLEKSLFKPYMAPKSFNSGQKIEWDGKYHLIYLTKTTCQNASDIPHIITHLLPYRRLMDERRETANGKREWFQLHWPREQMLFESPGIVSVRMTKDPTFCWTEGGVYFDLSVNVIVPKNPGLGKLLFCYLQSQLVDSWLRFRGKSKGEQLQVDGKPLRKIPVPDFDDFSGTVSTEAIETFAKEYFASYQKTALSKP